MATVAILCCPPQCITMMYVWRFYALAVLTFDFFVVHIRAICVLMLCALSNAFVISSLTRDRLLFLLAYYHNGYIVQKKAIPQ